MKKVYCGIITFENKKIGLFLNKENFKKEFFGIENNQWVPLDKEIYLKLDAIYNKPLGFLPITNSMKRRLASLLVATTLVSGVGTMHASASDIKDTTINVKNMLTSDSVQYLEDNHILENIDISDLNSDITRGEIYQILVNMGGLKNIGEMRFIDSSNHQYEQAMSLLGYNGIIGYNSDGRVYPDENINVQDFLPILYRYFVVTNKGIGTTNHSTRNEAILWSVQNELVPSIDIVVNSSLTKRQILDIIYKYIVNQKDLKFDVKDVGSEILAVINDNHQIPEYAKNIFGNLGSTFDRCYLDNATVDRIKNTFANLKYEIGETASYAAGEYHYDDNSIIVDEDYSQSNIVSLHESIHALSSDYANTGIVGLQNAYGFGAGINEGMTEILTEEFLKNPGNGTYHYSRNMLQLLLYATDPNIVLNCYVSANLDDFLEYLTNIYSKEYEYDEAYDKALQLISRFDTLKQYDLGLLPIDENYLLETLADVNNFLYISKGIFIGNSPLLEAQADKTINKSNNYNISYYNFFPELNDDDNQIIVMTKNGNAQSATYSVNTLIEDIEAANGNVSLENQKLNPTFDSELEDLLSIYDDFCTYYKNKNEKSSLLPTFVMRQALAEKVAIDNQPAKEYLINCVEKIKSEIEATTIDINAIPNVDKFKQYGFNIFNEEIESIIPLYNECFKYYKNIKKNSTLLSPSDLRKTFGNQLQMDSTTQQQMQEYINNAIILTKNAIKNEAIAIESNRLLSPEIEDLLFIYNEYFEYYETEGIANHFMSPEELRIMFSVKENETEEEMKKHLSELIEILRQDIGKINSVSDMDEEIKTR